MDAPSKPGSRRGFGVAGPLGLGLWLIGLLIGAIVAADYDPEAADFRDRASQETAVVTRVESDVLIVDHGGEPATVPLQARDVGRFSDGDTVLVFIAGPDDAQLVEDVPPSPQRAGAFVLPVIVMALGAMLVSSAPEVLYAEARRE